MTRFDGGVGLGRVFRREGGQYVVASYTNAARRIDNGRRRAIQHKVRECASDGLGR